MQAAAALAETSMVMQAAVEARDFQVTAVALRAARLALLVVIAAWLAVLTGPERLTLRLVVVVVAAAAMVAIRQLLAALAGFLVLVQEAVVPQLAPELLRLVVLAAQAWLQF